MSKLSIKHSYSFRVLLIYSLICRFMHIEGFYCFFCFSFFHSLTLYGSARIQDRIDSILPSEYFKWDKRIVKLKEWEIVIRLLLISIPRSYQKNSPQHRFRFQRLQPRYSEMTVYHLTKYYRI